MGATLEIGTQWARVSLRYSPQVERYILQVCIRRGHFKNLVRRHEFWIPEYHCIFWLSEIDPAQNKMQRKSFDLRKYQLQQRITLTSPPKPRVTNTKGQPFQLASWLAQAIDPDVHEISCPHTHSLLGNLNFGSHLYITNENASVNNKMVSVFFTIKHVIILPLVYESRQFCYFGFLMLMIGFL